jgi:DNA-directed RNA polymerase subunit RPC12/RpoP
VPVRESPVRGTPQLVNLPVQWIPHMEFVLLHSFPNYIEAHIIMGRLEEEGISCWLKDENTVTINPVLTQAVGGIKLMVAKPQFERALELFQGFEQQRRSRFSCPHCGGSEIELVSSPRKPRNWLTALAGAFFGDFAVASDKVWRCFQCHSEFEEPVERSA